MSAYSAYELHFYIQHIEHSNMIKICNRLMFNFFLHGTACLIHSHTNIKLIIISISILYMLQRALLKMELLVLHRCPTAIYTLFILCACL